MKIDMRTRLMALVGGIAVGLSLILIIALYSISKFDASIKEVEKHVERVRYSQVNFQNQVQEWKNILVRGYSKKDYDKYLSKFHDKQKNIQDLFDSLIADFSGKEEYASVLASIRTLKQEHITLYNLYTKALKNYDRTNPLAYRKVDSIVRGKDRTITRDFTSIVSEINRFSEEMIDSKERLIQLELFILSILIIIAEMLIAYFTINYMRKYNGTIKEHADLIGEGDFTHEVDENQGGDYKVLGSAFNGLYKTVGSIIANAQRTLMSVTSSVEETDMNVASMEGMLTEQQVAINQISEALNDLVRNIENININAQESQKEAENMRTSAQAVGGVMHDLLDIAQDMSVKLKIIDDISEQINLLSLNASIESARAGEAGRGFAVVAEEIRKLATKTNNATSEIKGRMKSLTDSSKNAQGSVSEITEAIGEVFKKSSEVSGAVDHQSAAVAQVSATVEEFSGNLNSVTENVKQTAQAMKDVARSTQDLDSQMSVFKTR